MLILTRKAGEQIMINKGSIRLKVLHVDPKFPPKIIPTQVA